MKLFTNILLAAAMAVTSVPAAAQLSVYDMNKPLGWATVGGSVTGGNDENPVTGTRLSELKSALSGTEKKTI